MRAVRRLIIVLVILFGLFVAADRITVNVAESQVADRFQTARGLSEKPSVDIEGFPFLTQLAGGSLDHVTVHATNMTLQSGGEQSVVLADFRADLRHVKLEDNYSSALAGSATGTALISYSEVSALLPNHLTISYAGGSRVHLAATVPGFSQRLSLTAGLDFQGSKINLTSVGGLSALAKAFGVSESQLTSLVSGYVGTGFQVAGLPGGLAITGVQAVPGGVSVSVAGSGVSLTSTAD